MLFAELVQIWGSAVRTNASKLLLMLEKIAGNNVRICLDHAPGAEPGNAVVRVGKMGRMAVACRREGRHTISVWHLQ